MNYCDYTPLPNEIHIQLNDKNYQTEAGDEIQLGPLRLLETETVSSIVMSNMNNIDMFKSRKEQEYNAHEKKLKPNNAISALNLMIEQISGENKHQSAEKDRVQNQGEKVALPLPLFRYLTSATTTKQDKLRTAKQKQNDQADGKIAVNKRSSSFAPKPDALVDQLMNHIQSLIETSKSTTNRFQSLLQTNKALLAEVSKLKLENAQLKKAAYPERSTPSTIGTSATSHQDYTHSSKTQCIPAATTSKNFAIILLDRDNEISSLKQALTDTTRHHESFVRRAEKRMASEREAMLSEIHILKDRLRKAEDTSDDYKQKIIDVLQASHSTRETENRKLKREIKILKNRKKFKSPVGKEKEEYDIVEESEKSE